MILIKNGYVKTMVSEDILAGGGDSIYKDVLFGIFIPFIGISFK